MIRVVHDLSFFEKKFQFIPFADSIGVADNRRNAVVKAISIENPGKALGQNSLNAIELDHEWRMLPTRPLTEVLASDDEIPLSYLLVEPRSFILQNMFCQLRQIRSQVEVASRYDMVCTDSIA